MSEKDSFGGCKGTLALALGLLVMAPSVQAAPAVSDDNRAATVSLSTIQVKSQAQQDYAQGRRAAAADVGLLGKRQLNEVPFSITSYTATTVADKQASSVVDVIKADAAVTQATAATNINEDFTIRGFGVSSADVAFNGMYGLMPYFRVPVAMAERVELLKGPSAMLNGMPPSGNIGGAINLVPKRAGVMPLTRLTGILASDSQLGMQADIGRRFGSNNAFGARINATYDNGDTAIDRQSREASLGSMALDYRGEKLRASLDLLHQKESIDRVVRQFTVGSGVTEIPDAPDSRLNYPGYGFVDQGAKMALGRLDYDLNAAVSLYAAYGVNHSVMDALAGNVQLTSNAGNFGSTPAWQVQEVQVQSLSAGAKGNFAFMNRANQWSLDYSRVDTDKELYFLVGAFAPRLSNIYDPVPSDTPDLSGYSKNMQPFQSQTLSSVALADTVYFLDDKLQLTLGARHQQVKQQAYNFMTGQPVGSEYDESALTPTVGVVIKPWQQLSFYASYIEGLSQGPTAPVGTVNAGEVFDPLTSKQMEVGVKTTQRDWRASLAIYQLSQTSGFVDTGNKFGINGEQRHRGMELNLQSDLRHDLHALVSASHIDSDLVDTAGGLYDGNQGMGVPEFQSRLGLAWDASFLPGLALSANVAYSSRMYVDQVNKLSLPSWIRYSTGANYRTKLGGKAVTLRASVDNLTDEDDWGTSTGGYFYVLSPRTYKLSLSVDL